MRAERIVGFFALIVLASCSTAHQVHFQQRSAELYYQSASQPGRKVEALAVPTKFYFMGETSQLTPGALNDLTPVLQRLTNREVSQNVFIYAPVSAVGNRRAKWLKRMAETAGFDSRKVEVKMGDCIEPSCRKAEAECEHGKGECIPIEIVTQLNPP